MKKNKQCDCIILCWLPFSYRLTNKLYLPVYILYLIFRSINFNIKFNSQNTKKNLFKQKTKPNTATIKSHWSETNKNKTWSWGKNCINRYRGTKWNYKVTHKKIHIHHRQTQFIYYVMIRSYAHKIKSPIKNRINKEKSVGFYILEKDK